jgi:uncharacterized iron-regulated membrane protein
LIVGIAVGLVVVFLAITGCLMAFQQQVIAFSERNVRAPERREARTPCLAPSQILAAAVIKQGAEPVSWTLFADQTKASEIVFPEGKLLLVDPCDGHVLSANAGKLRSFFLSVRDLHRYVAWGGVRHENLRAVKNAINLGFIFLLISGLILWFPRKLTWRHVKVGFVPRWSRAGRASEWSLHTVIGFWLSLPLACIALTGAVMGYAWANALLYRAAGDPPPAVRAEREANAAVLPVARYAQLDVIVAKASQQDPKWNSLLLRIPSPKGKDITITLDEGDGRDPRTKSQLVLNRKTAEIVRWDRFQDNVRGRQWRLYARFLHTGELFGLTGQAVAFLSSCGALLLVWTGISLSVRRFSSWRSRRKRTRLPAQQKQAQVVTS